MRKIDSITIEDLCMRAFRAGNPELLPPDKPPPPPIEPMPGPTLRAKVGDLVQLSFVNAVYANRFDQNFVIGQDGCMQVGPTVPSSKFPNCLHASSTANIHYHGTHTNPNATGDNVFLQILPLPRDNQGNLTTTPAQASSGRRSPRNPGRRSSCRASTW